jgi:hypothetical protein
MFEALSPILERYKCSNTISVNMPDEVNRLNKSFKFQLPYSILMVEETILENGYLGLTIFNLLLMKRILSKVL